MSHAQGAKRPGTSRLDRAVSEANRLDPGWKLAEIEAKRVPPGKGSAGVLDSTRSRFSKATEAEGSASNGAIDTRPGQALDPAEVGELTRFVDRNKEILPLLRKLADLPTGRFAYRENDRNNKNLLAILFPHLDPLRGQVRLLLADAVLRANRGEPDEALASCRAALAAARTLSDEPTQISQIVRFACDAATQRTILFVLRRGRASEAALAQAQRLISEETDQESVLVGMRGDRAILFETFGNLADGSLTLDGLLTTLELADPIPAQARKALQRPGVLRESQAIVLERRTRDVELVRRPSWTWHEGVKGLERLKSRRPKLDPRRNPEEILPALFESAQFPLVNSELRIDALGRALSILIAAERYSLANDGRRPASIAALVPKYLKALPIDPMSGKPMKLLARGNVLIAYSVGLNGRDEQGNITKSDEQDVEKSADVGFELATR